MAQEFVDPRREKHESVPFLGHLVELVIGSERKSIYVQDRILSKTSKFIKTALKKEWAEGQQRVLNLPEEDVETMTTYIQFLYAGTIDCTVKDEEKGEAFIYLSKLYTLGERLLDPEFQNRVIDSIIATSRDWVNGTRYRSIGEAVNRMFEGTTKGSPGRRLLVDIWCDRGQGDWVQQGKVKLNEEFMEDTMVALMDARERLAGSDARCKALFEGVPTEYYKSD